MLWWGLLEITVRRCRGGCYLRLQYANSIVVLPDNTVLFASAGVGAA
jgi:hypothetical protein